MTTYPDCTLPNQRLLVIKNYGTHDIVVYGVIGFVEDGWEVISIPSQLPRILTVSGVSGPLPMEVIIGRTVVSADLANTITNQAKGHIILDTEWGQQTAEFNWWTTGVCECYLDLGYSYFDGPGTKPCVADYLVNDAGVLSVMSMDVTTYNGNGYAKGSYSGAPVSMGTGRATMVVDYKFYNDFRFAKPSVCPQPTDNLPGQSFTIALACFPGGLQGGNYYLSTDHSINLVNKKDYRMGVNYYWALIQTLGGGGFFAKFPGALPKSFWDHEPDGVYSWSSSDGYGNITNETTVVLGRMPV